MVKRTKYDIFISYRRDSFNQANLICTRLKALGYRVFIDVEALNSGKFNEQLLSVITNCKDFIIVLPPNALDRCINTDDWVRREVMCAMENKKNIIPIMLSGFEWPTQMPEGMEDLCMYQSLAPMPDVYFDMQIKKLQGYLKSKAHFKKRRRWVIGLAIAAVVAIILYMVAHAVYMPMAKKLSDSLFIKTQQMVNFDGINSSAYKAWLDFLEEYAKTEKQEDKDECAGLFLAQLSSLEKESDELHEMIRKDKIEVSEFYYPMLWVHGLNPYDLTEIDPYIEMCFEDMNGSFAKYREVMEFLDDVVYRYVPQAISPYLGMVELNYLMNHTVVEAYYYTYLMILTHLPEATHERFYKMSLKWENMPKTGLGLPDKEYERLMNMSYEKCEQQVDKIQQLQDEVGNLLDIINAQLENILKEEDAQGSEGH